MYVNSYLVLSQQFCLLLGKIMSMTLSIDFTWLPILTYTHYYIKMDSQQDRNSTQYSIITYMGRDLKKNRYMSMSISDTLLYTRN